MQDLIVIEARERDLGGFKVRRVLPYMKRRMVGPFIFFDQMGPASFASGESMDVRPHPHINLATVTYLFAGQILHRDSLGSYQLIEPGAVNWMVAGKGIVHSERTPELLKEKGYDISGIQCWIALPVESEEISPSFAHHPASSLPEFEINQVKFKLLLGSAFGYQSPVAVLSELFYLDVRMPRGSQFTLPKAQVEAAAYVIQGQVQVGTQKIDPYSMIVDDSSDTLTLQATEDSTLMLLGGKPLGERFLFWNFVSSSKARLEEAKKEWLSGPRPQSLRFLPIPGDDQEFIPLPQEPDKPGTSL